MEDKTKEIPYYDSFSANDRLIRFGVFPQELKEEEVTVSDVPDSDGYYLGSDGNRYARLTATPYDDSFPFQNGTLIKKGRKYWFKVSPITWQVLRVRCGVAFLVSEQVLAAGSHMGGGEVSVRAVKFPRLNLTYTGKYNPYDNSGIRHWINREFFTAAFTPSEQARILTTLVDNGVESTNEWFNNNVCPDTEDKIFLLSAAEVVKQADEDETSAFVSRFPTDYARAMGVNGDRAADTEAKRWEYTWWWLRSPDSVYEDYVKACEGWRLRTHDGQEDGGGIVPALFINLPRGR